MHTNTPLPPAGWFTDPADESRQRWWDGAAWTDQLQAALPPVVDAPAGSQPLSRRELRAQLGGALTYGEEPAATTTAAATATPEPEPEPAAAWPPSWAPSWATEPAPAAAPTPEAPALAQQSIDPSPTPTPSYSGYTSPSKAWDEWGPIGDTETPGAWLLTLTPLLFVGLSVVTTWASSAEGPGVIRFAGIGLVVFLSLRFARMDVALLHERRYGGVPNSWFAIIPLAYLIARVVTLGTGALKLLIVHIGVLLVSAAVAIWFVFAVILAPEIPPGYKVINAEERSAMLTPEGAAAQLEFDFEYYGNSEVTDVVCQPFPSEAAGAESNCSLRHNGRLIELKICVDPEMPLVAFFVCGPPEP